MRAAIITGGLALALLAAPGILLWSAKAKARGAAEAEVKAQGASMQAKAPGADPADPKEPRAGRNPMDWKKLTPEEQRVIVDKGTEMPFTGKYYDFHEDGTYTCKRCGAVLFRSTDKFDAGCGWPSFDDAVPGAVRRTLDADGHRIEITCANCGAHLGHVFLGEGFTPKNTRYCVNSISLGFVPAAGESAVATEQAPTGTEGGESAEARMSAPSAASTPAPEAVKAETEKAYFAGGCFWGTQYLFEKRPGVVSTRVGYMGGHTRNPTYQEVCGDTTGYAETVEVVFDPAKTSYEDLAKFFFEIHDPTEVNRQGPDVGTQYRSEIFYVNDAQRAEAEKLVRTLERKGLRVATTVAAAGPFYQAEDYHQDYYKKTGGEPYCHIYTNRF